MAATMEFADWEALVIEQLQLHRDQVSLCFNDLFKQEVESQT